MTTEGRISGQSLLIFAGNSSGPEMLSLKPGEQTVLSFALGEGDIGGTLAVELALIHSRVGPRFLY